MESITKEKILMWILFKSNLKFRNRANNMIEIRKYNVAYKNNEVVIKPLSNVRSFIEYYVEVWTPYLRKTIEIRL